MGYAEQDRGTTLIIVAWVFLVIASIIVGLRFWVRLTRIHHLAADDWIMLISLVSEYLHTIFICVAYTYGLGRHITTLSDYNRLHAIKWIVVIQFFAIVTSMFGRISFSAFLLQIVGPHKRWQRTCLWGVIVLQLVVTIPTLIQIYTQCGTNLSALWDPATAEYASCESPRVQTIIGFFQSGLNSLCDLVLTILPCFILWHLHMPIGTKIGLGAVLTLSIFALGASIVKAVEIRNLTQRSDFTWAFVSLTMWVCVENNVVIIAASIPTLRPILKRNSSTSTHGSGGLRRGSEPLKRSTTSSDGASKFTKRGSDATWLGAQFQDMDPTTGQSVSVAGAGLDDQSDEHVMHPLRDRAITKTTDVRIAWEENDLESGLETASHGAK